ncbi:880_t:CDS:2 [Diversispora eburnea]|uniref:Eukaryotic translation initiation factor 5A n=1 Tax=Diversispora eburnea TaxID=1213867 RepID=A0A9N9C401_9GLOM|nr:880_t:CDS:2 [Diversispora eburnea]
MEDESHHDFGGSGSGASATYPIQCSALRKNGYVLLKGRPCKIVEMTTSKTGKHGHAVYLSPSTHNMDVPNVTRVEYQLLNIDDGFLSLMTSDGSTKDDVRKELLITIISAMGEEAAISYKEAPRS